MRIRFLTPVFCLALLAIFVSEALCQFPGEPPGGPAGTSDSDEAPGRPDELVRQLESRAARGGTDRAEAIRMLARLGAWPQVDRWLSQITGVTEEAELAETARLIGNDMLLRISLRSEISDASRAAIKQLSAATKKFDQTPDRLRQAIDQLATGGTDEVLAANRVLMSGGEASVQELVAAIVGGLSGKQPSRVLALLQALGDGGARALEQLSLYGNESARAASLQALSQLDPDLALDSLVCAGFAADATAEESGVARQSGVIPADFEPLDAIATLADRLDSLRKIADRTSNDSTPATLWSVAEDRSGVQYNRTTAIFQSYRDAYDAAQRLRRIGGLPPAVQRNALAADLSYRLMVDPDWGDASQLDEIRAAYPALTQPQALLKSIAVQRQLGDVPSVVGLLRLLSGTLQGDETSGWVIGLQQGRLDDLVDCVRDAEPRIRYESATCIVELLKEQGSRLSFPGSSYFRATLSEMASLQQRPTAILIETRPAIALRQESILLQLGYEVRLVRSAIEAEREVARGGDLRLVVSKVEVADAVSSEVVDRVRRLPRGARVAIVFYSDVETHEKSVVRAEWETTSQRWTDEQTPAVFLVPLPGSPTALTEVLAEINGKRRLPALSVSDRVRFREVGAAALQGDSPLR